MSQVFFEMDSYVMAENHLGPTDMVLSSRFGYTIRTLSQYGRCVVHVTYEGMYRELNEFLRRRETI